MKIFEINFDIITLKSMRCTLVALCARRLYRLKIHFEKFRLKDYESTISFSFKIQQNNNYIIGENVTCENSFL